MGSVSNARAVYGLLASGSPAKVNVNGALTIGVDQTQVAFTDADIAYSFKVTSTGASDVARLDMSAGTVAQITGTPTIEDAGADFEGSSLPTLVTGYVVCVTTPADNSDVVDVQMFGAPLTGPWPPEKSIEAGGWFIGTIGDVYDLNFTFSASGDVVTVTILGKST